MRMRDQPFTLIKRHVQGGGPGVEFARFECRQCGGHDEFQAATSGRNCNMVATAARAEAAGWAFRNSRATCPRCLAASRARAKGESPAPKPIPPAMVARAAIPAPTETTMPDPKPVMREATPQERVKIRGVLDKHFDDGAGCWLDGYSDQKAGEEVGVPWAIVTRIREAAYGPIRVDPEVVGLRAELAQIGRDLAALTEKHAAAAKRLDGLAARRAA